MALSALGTARPSHGDRFVVNPGKMRKKGDLPEKTCAACGRPFVWRKKWARCWDEIKTCSERCRGDFKRRAEARSPRP